MTIQSTTAAWLRFLSGEPLDETERQALEREIIDDDVLRTSLAEDQRLHRVLTSIGPIDKSRDQFVDNVVAACTGADSTFAVTPANREESQPSDARVSLRRNPLVLILGGAVLTLAVALLLVTAQYFRGQRVLPDDDARTAADNTTAPEPGRGLKPLVEAAPNPLRAIQPADDAGNSDNKDAAADTHTDAGAKVKEIAVARISHSDHPVWKKTPSADAIPAGRLELIEGEAELTFSGGSSIGLKAPVAIELLDPTHVRLEKGRLAALVPPRDIGFRVDTPNSKIVDLGTRFGVTVDDLGQSDVDLTQGEVVVIPWRGDDSGRRWHLKSGQYDRATVFPAPEANESLLASRISGPSGFRGEIQLSGESMDFSSEDHFDRILRGVRDRFKESSAQAAADWLALAKTFNQTTGSFTMDGKDVPFDNLDGLLKIEDSLVDPPQRPGAVAPQGNGFFLGQVIINGQKRTFHSREEYEKFRREMLQPLDRFGLGGPAETQFERDKRTNPFQP